MKLLVLSLLVLTSVCFVLGAEEDSFDLDANEGELFDAPENFVEDEENVSYTHLMKFDLMESGLDPLINGVRIEIRF